MSSPSYGNGFIRVERFFVDLISAFNNPNDPAARYSAGGKDYCWMISKPTLPAALFAWFFLANPLFAADLAHFWTRPAAHGMGSQ